MISLQSEVRDLLAKRKRIQEFLYEHADQLEAIRNKTQPLPSTDWLLECAENITPTLRAPKDWVPGRPLHDLGGHPPAPQFEQMRLGILGQLHQTRLASGPVELDTTIEVLDHAQIDELVLARGKRKSVQPKQTQDVQIKIEEAVAAPVEVVQTNKRRAVNIDFGFGNDSDDEED